MRPTSFFVALSIVCAPTTGRAAELYVSPSGVDEPARGGSSAPWRTLQYAADRVNPGDTVHVANGDYVGFYLERGGTAGARITFVAEGDAVRVTARNNQTPDGINVEGAPYVTIDGFIVNDMPRTGVRCALSDHVVIRRIRADRNGRWGILTGFCADIVIEDNVTTRSVAEHGIYHSNSADRPILRRNIVWGNRGNGIHMNGDASQGGDGQITGALIERNIIYDNGTGGGSGINCDGVSSSIIRNNLLYLSRASGISLYRIDGAAGSSQNLVVHNTVIQSSTGRWALNIRDASTGNTVRNNIFLTEHATRGSIVIDDASRAGFTSDYNVITPRLSPDGDTTILGLAAWQALGYDTHSAASTSALVFENAAANDYHLRVGSPAIDTADPTNTVAEDLDGHARSVGAGPDIGAYERGVATALDAGVADAGAGAQDAGAHDAGAAQDAGALSDAGVRVDAGGAMPPDAGSSAAIDAGRDAGVTPSAATGGCGCEASTGGAHAFAIWLAAVMLLASRSRRRA
jgi:hypothetical protein